MTIRISLFIIMLILLGIFMFQNELIRSVEKDSSELKDMVKKGYSEIPLLEPEYHSITIESLDNYLENGNYIILDHLRRMRQTNWILLISNVLLILGFIFYQLKLRRN